MECQPALDCGEEITSFNGIPARSNGIDNCGSDACGTPPGTPPGEYGQEYLCTELVNRYYNQYYNIPVTNWKVVAKDYCTNHPNGVYVVALEGQQTPEPGDIFVKSSGSLGHVAIVTEYLPDGGDSSPAVKVIEQNANVNGVNTYPVYYPHEGCFLSTNYDRSCDNLSPNDPSCGIISNSKFESEHSLEVSNNPKTNSLGTSATLGISLGAILFVIGLVFLGFFYVRSRKNAKNQPTAEKSGQKDDQNDVTSALLT